MANEIIEMKKVDDVYEAVDMNPYSEYVHPGSETKQREAAQRQQAAMNAAMNETSSREQALKNLDEFMVGVDTMMHVAEKFMERFHKFRKIL